MEIYAIDDKREEAEKAWAAIELRGHRTVSADNGFNFNCVLLYAEYGNCSKSAKGEIIDAIKHLKEVGGGIITDMMFPLAPCHANNPCPPSGLLVVIQALVAGVPVVVCTDASEVGGHHSEALSWIFDGYIGDAVQRGDLPFGWVENKDWDAAVKLLEQIHAQQKEKEVKK